MASLVADKKAIAGMCDIRRARIRISPFHQVIAYVSQNFEQS
jgi:hypothetical protein